VRQVTEAAIGDAGSPAPAILGRRAEYAEATRRAVMEAARRLFTERGYFATTVRDIADASRVSPATVYAVGGGKEVLLQAWMQEWLTGPAFADSYARLYALDDADAIIRMTAEVVGNLRIDWGDIMRVAVTTAPHHEEVASSLLLAREQYQRGFTNIANRLAELGALKRGLDAKEAAKILWFYFGFPAYNSAIDDNCWSYAHTESWLYKAASASLLRV
jgi:AcrR family transcriptional regulator